MRPIDQNEIKNVSGGGLISFLAGVAVLNALLDNDPYYYEPSYLVPVEYTVPVYDSWGFYKGEMVVDYGYEYYPTTSTVYVY